MCYWKLQNSMFSEACLGLRKQGLFLKSNHFPLFNIYQIYGEQWLSVNRSPAQRAGAHFWKLVTYSIYIWSEPAFYQTVLHSVPRLEVSHPGGGALGTWHHLSGILLHHLYNGDVASSHRASSGLKWGTEGSTVTGGGQPLPFPHTRHTSVSDNAQQNVPLFSI